MSINDIHEEKDDEDSSGEANQLEGGILEPLYEFLLTNETYSRIVGIWLSDEVNIA